MGVERPSHRPSRLQWRGADTFAVDDVEYVCRPRFDTFDSTPRRFCIRKPRREVERLEELLDRLRPATVFEVGIERGGSTALIAQLATPEKLVAIDINQEQADGGLAGFIDARELNESVAVHWGVDQSDREALAQIAATDLGGGSLDLVIDDASHYLGPSRMTFNAMFPRLRTGGTYVLEDWSWAHAPINLWPGREPLTVLVFEMVIAAAHNPGVVATVEIDRAWTVLTRGEADVDPESFDLASLLGDEGRALLAGARGKSTKAPKPSHLRPWRRGRR